MNVTLERKGWPAQRCEKPARYARWKPLDMLEKKRWTSVVACLSYVCRNLKAPVHFLLHAEQTSLFS
jgi:hypothetical protein